MSLKTQQIRKPDSESAEDQTETILNLLSEGICRLDSEGHITYANRSACDMLDTRPEDTIGKHYAEVFFSSDRQKYVAENDFCPIGFVLTEGEVSHVNADSFCRADGGEMLTVEYMCLPVCEGERVTGAVISFQDVTERLDVERAVNDAKEAAFAAARTKAAFLANMSHEIRTPLSGIIGTAGLLRDSKLDTEQSRYVRMLEKSTGLLASIVNDILDFSKIEAGKFEREQISFDLRETATDTIDFFNTFTEGKYLHLWLDIDEEIPVQLVGDLQSIRQILNNFISNAIKFTDAGEVLLKIEQLARPKDDAVRLRFSVSDEGIGIDKESQEKLFSPFTQADSSITRKFGGTGLGLAICRQLVELLGGAIGVESKPGEGAVFWFEADLGIARPGLSEQTAGQPAQTSAEEKQVVRARQDIRLLIVEDNPTNRDITAAMFRQLGVRPALAENGREAVRACLDTEFDLILMDCHMPEMDGFEAAELIRRQENVFNIPRIVAFTASITRSERDRCFRVGMDDYLSKPFTKQDLSDVLEKHFHIQSLPENLDLEENMIQHSLSNLIEPRMLRNLLDIETGGQPGFVFEILDVFLEHAEIKIAETDTAISTHDRDVIRANAHNLKGSGSNVGLTDISRLFEDLESKSKEADWSEIESLFERTKRVFAETKQKILDKKP